MASKNFKRSCIYTSAFLLSVSFPLASHAGTPSPQEPETTTSIVRQPEGYSSDGQQVVNKPTDPVMVTSTIPEKTQPATDPVTTKSRNPAGVSSKSNIVEKQASLNINDNVVMVSGQLSLGLVNGTAKELVYDPPTGHKNSELDWQIDNVFMLGAGISVKPLSWLRFNGNVWFQPGNGDGSLDDYDWEVEGWDWTKWSHHNSVSVKEGLMYDINAELTFLRFNETSVFALLGYKHDHWKWEARGGNFIYSTYYLRDTYFSLSDDLKVGTYEQTYDVPYLGIGFHANLHPVTLDGRIIGSTLVSSSDKDTHLLRDLVITSDIDSGHMFGLDFACTYNFTSNFAATAAFQYQKFEELKGTKTWNSVPEGYNDFKYGGGLSLETTMISLSLMYSL
jgi:plasminogen activator